LKKRELSYQKLEKRKTLLAMGAAPYESPNKTNKNCNRYKYLVFSAHGHFDINAPALSSIVLDQLNKTKEADGYITASEWVGYDLKSDLMFLSACQTGRGKIVRGEGIMGLPYAFYVAGNKNTIMTLWNVNDKSTAEFTSKFFARLKDGMTQLKALTATKREFFNSKKYKRALYWAPFVLYGI
jgi:CHAT domain-containing protein